MFEKLINKKYYIMKKSLATFLGLFIFVSCSSDQNISKGDEAQLNSKNIEFNLNYIGEEHNKGLNYIYNKISSSNYTFDIEDYSKSYYDINNVTEEYLNYSNIDKSKKVYFYNKKDIDVFLLQKINFSSNAKKILNDYNILFDSDDNLDVVNQKMKDLNKELDFSYSKKLLFDKEYLILKSYMITGQYSLDYWGKNIDNWITNIDRNIEKSKTSNKYQTKSWDWDRFKRAAKNMAKADARGAAVGAVGGLIFGSAAGPGGTVLGAAGGAVAFGMNGSAVAGAVELYNGYVVVDQNLNFPIFANNLNLNDELFLSDFNKNIATPVLLK
ncbi:hypothetical protein M2306_001071 [Myroides gitamensis]|uniref:hypothetical protein n=1 Tax=Myroides odoratus TaxID=256 RepID=UPI002168DD3D|nr:hypothetical protein [Myroides odoratus]MCS4238689.1 hypothetical protein [Myroides odoratus]MDH6600377.1 hypothetical protein [Myroides gitamensis]